LKTEELRELIGEASELGWRHIYMGNNGF